MRDFDLRRRSLLRITEVVKKLASEKILVTEKPQGFRVATDFFNNEEDIEQLIHRLHGFH